jgi:hypothetical protein
MNYYHPQTLEHIRNPLPAVADWAGITDLEPPAYDPQAESCRFVDGLWLVEVNLPPAPIVPGAVTMRQARLALLSAGLLSQVDVEIGALPSPQKEAAQIEWEYSQEVQRHNGFVALLAPSLGLTEAQLDQLFITAAGL